MALTISSQDSPLLRSNQEEREATQKINASLKRVEEAQREATQNIEAIQDRYEIQSKAEIAREEEALNKEQLKGYQRIRDLQRAQEVEMRRVRRVGDNDILRLKEYYRNQIQDLDRRLGQELHDLQSQGVRAIDYERRSALDQQNNFQLEHALRMGELKDHSEAQIDRLRHENQLEYEKIKEESIEAKAQAEKKFQEKFQTITSHQTEVLNDLENSVSQQIQAIRNDTSTKLSAYGSRQSDPFYKLFKINARLTDTGKEFVLTADIPQHEQNHVSVAIKGNNLVITGYRRNEEALEVEPGHTQGSASFQSFHETFPLSWPVDSKKVSREYRENQVIIRVPKLSEYAYKTPQLDTKLIQSKVHSPHFPENLPKTSDESSAKAPRILPKNSGSGTLS